ncbi:MAG: hypothetical protein ACRCTI_00825 [Beijerinckiaceae bacterium]
MTRRNEFDAHRYLRETRNRHPMRRSTDRDYRSLWIALVGVATAVALWGTFH